MPLTKIGVFNAAHIKKRCPVLAIDYKEAKIEPAIYTSEQWQRFFDTNQHARFVDIRTRFTPGELKAIQTYLMQQTAIAGKPEALEKPPVKK